MRVSLVAVGAFAALALGAGCSGDRAAAPPPPSDDVQPAPEPVANGPLVFARPVQDDTRRRYALLATDAAGEAATRFTRRLCPDRDVAVSPDGQTVAFTRPAQTGSGAWRLGGPHDIFLADVTDGQPRRLERSRNDERAPRFSDDGRWLAFAYQTSIESARVGIVEIDDPGSWDVLSARGDQWGGSWEPGTHRILYSHGSFLNGKYTLYVTDADTAEVTRMPGTEELGVDGGAWTPSGQIFTVTADESKRPDETSVWLLGKDGSEARVIATTRGRLYHGLAFAPDDSRIALGVDFDDRGVRIAVVELGVEPVDVTADMGVPGWSPLWSPDGTTIAFLRDSGVWLIDADGSNPRRVENSEGAERLVAWLEAPAD